MRLFVLCVGLLAAFALQAWADVPPGDACTIECWIPKPVRVDELSGSVCPAGDMEFVQVVVTVRDSFGNPLAGREVECFPDAGSASFCWCPGSTPLIEVTNVQGEAWFGFPHFGGCGTLEFSADCEGVPIGPSNSVEVSSPDINADCAVTLHDFARFAMLYGTGDSCGDYDWDSEVGLSDFAIFAAHYGDECPAP